METQDLCVEAYTLKKCIFRFRGLDLTIRLSHGLFSSADIDTGTRLLLKVFSQFLDDYERSGKPLPSRILDAGCGTGIIGIAAAKALSALREHTNQPANADNIVPLTIRCQDRDELASVFTRANARENGIDTSTLEACTEALLSEPGPWDLVLSNIPAKAGHPVLKDFVYRSVRSLSQQGCCICVVVKPLCNIFRDWIQSSEAHIEKEHEGKEHTVFVYTALKSADTARPLDSISFVSPVYIRNQGKFLLEKTEYTMQTVHGSADFDQAGNSIQLAARITTRTALRLFEQRQIQSVLIHGDAQGHYASWLRNWAARFSPAGMIFCLSGRIVPGLQAAGNNVLNQEKAANQDFVRLCPCIDPYCGQNAILGKLPAGNQGSGYDMAVMFPELVPRTDRLQEHWEAMETLLRPGALLLCGLGSADAERFDRIRSSAFTRHGDIKRNGFRVLAYVKKQISDS